MNDLTGNPDRDRCSHRLARPRHLRCEIVVDNFENFVSVQTESALRHMASSYPYDEPQPGEAGRAQASTK